MEKYESYKPSGVEWMGEIPESWKPIQLKYACEISKTSIQVSDFKDHEVIHYSIPNIQKFGTGVKESGAEIESSKLLLEGQEVIISKLNPRKTTVCIVENHESMTVASGEFLIFKPFKISPRFLYYYFINPRYAEFLDSSVESVTRSHQRVSPEIVYHSFIFLPLLPEQTQIVSYLDRKTALIDSLIDKTERKIELLKEKRIALINQAVTKGLDPNVPMKDSGVEWIGEIPEHWETSFLRLHLSKIGSGSTPRGGSEVYVEIGVPLIRSQNVHFDGLRLTDVSKIDEAVHQKMSGSTVRKNDVLLNITGGSIGRCCVNNESQEMNVNQHVCILRTKSNLINEFLNYFLQSDFGQEQVSFNISGGNREGLTITGIGDFRIILPPIGEQKDIIHNLTLEIETIQKLASIENKRIAALKEYRQALISEVVTGKIKVSTDD